MADEQSFNPKNPDKWGVGSETQFLLIPGAIMVFLVVYFIYKLLKSYKDRELQKEEKRRQKAEKKKK